MKNLVLLVALTFSSLAQAGGGGVGNGGMAYVCRDEVTHQITRARLLDLWEPETFKVAQDNTRSVDEQVRLAESRLSGFFNYGSQKLAKYIREDQTRIMRVSKPLIPSNDVLPRYAPEPGCKYEQVAVYGYDDELHKIVLKIYSEIFDSPEFSNTDRAALFVHEAIYRLDRENHNAVNSRKTRKTTALLFSSSPSEIKDRSRFAIADIFIKNRIELLPIGYIDNQYKTPLTIGTYANLKFKRNLFGDDAIVDSKIWLSSTSCEMNNSNDIPYSHEFRLNLNKRTKSFEGRRWKTGHLFYSSPNSQLQKRGVYLPSHLTRVNLCLEIIPRSGTSHSEYKYSGTIGLTLNAFYEHSEAAFTIEHDREYFFKGDFQSIQPKTITSFYVLLMNEPYLYESYPVNP